MLEDVLQNRQHLLICIQYEVLQKKEVFEAYTSFCEILGDNVMEYSEFDFWFYYFLNGSFDLNYERKTEPKPLGLSDMPIEVAYKIVQKLNWKGKFIFRDVSKKCREAVDETPTIINEIYLSEYDHGTVVTFDAQLFAYDNHRKDDLVESDEEGTEYDDENEEENDFEDEDYYEEEDEEGNDSDEEILGAEEREKYEKQVVKTLAIVLSNPRIQIKELTFHINEQTLVAKLNDLFKSLNHQLHVESFKFEDCQWIYPRVFNFMKFLSHFKPGVLESIEVINPESFSPDFDSKLEVLSTLEQWNQAKKFKTHYKIFDNIDKVAHFDYLRTSITRCFKPEHVVYLKNVYLNSPTFKSCELFGSNVDEERIREALGGDKFPMVDGSTLHVDVSQYHVTFTKE